MFAIGLSLLACVGWGVADFLGGYKSRQLPTLTVLVLSNVFGLLVIGSIVAVRGRWVPNNPLLLWAVIGGLAGIVAMVSLYKALAIGSMSIVAPISGTGVILPVMVGAFLGDRLTAFQTIGMILAIVGSILASRERERRSRRGRLADGVGLAFCAAAAAGVFFIVMDQASSVDPYWAVLIMRSSYGVFLLPLALTFRPSFKVSGKHYPAIVTLGTVDALAGFSFAVATTIGLLSLVSVIGSLYPAVTVLLSTAFLRERPQGVQLAGVVLALSGVVLISV